MDKYVEAEKRLAELRGWTDLTVEPIYNELHGKSASTGTVLSSVPMWTRDNAEAFALMIEHDVCPAADKSGVEVQNGTMYWDVLVHEDFADHPNKEAAYRYAIVMAVIARLEEQEQ